MKIAIVVGHNEKAQGAVRADGVTEFQWCSDLAARIAKAGGDRVRVFFRKPAANVRAEIAACYADVDKWGADLSVELHFNSFANPTASGAETLSSGSEKSVALAVALQSAIVGVMQGRDRGVQVVDKAGRGGLSLHLGKCPAALVEPFFGSNPERCKVADDRRDDLAKAIFAACLSQGAAA